MSTDQFNKDIAKSLLIMAGFSILHVREIRNQYYPNRPDPWFLIQTEFGVIMIGWRKHVINIEWTFCPFRGVITDDDVTKDPDMVHAWTYEKALEYLTKLHNHMKEYSNA